MPLIQLSGSKHFCVSTVVRIFLLMVACVTINVCLMTNDSVASWDIINPGTVYIGVFKTELFTLGALPMMLDRSLLTFLDDSEKAGWVCDGAKPLAQAMEAFVVMSAVLCSLAMLSAVPFRDIRVLNASIALGVAASVVQVVAIALWVAFRHIKCTVGGTHQPRFPDGSDTYGIVLMSISLVFIVASVPLGVFSRTAHKEAFSYVSIQ